MIRRSARNDPSAGCATLGDLIKEEQEYVKMEETNLGQLLQDSFSKHCADPVRGSDPFWQNVAETFLKQVGYKIL